MATAQENVDRRDVWLQKMGYGQGNMYLDCILLESWYEEEKKRLGLNGGKRR